MDRDRSTSAKPSSDDPENEERTPGGQKPEDIEDRPLVSKVKPEDYPEGDRASGRNL